MRRRRLYSFDGIAGELVFFDEQGQSGPILLLDYRILDPNGAVFVADGLGGVEPGSLVLPLGTYTIEVGDGRDDAIGAYSFQILP